MAKKAKKAAKKSAKPVKKALAKKVLAIPPGPQLCPYFTVNNATKAVEFYKQVFGAKTKALNYGPDGKTIVHANLQIGNAHLMLSEPMGPGQQPNTSSVFLYVKDTDAVFAKAIQMGGNQIQPVANQFWGDRWGMFADPFGNVWQVATHLEDVKPAELARRAAAAMGGQPGADAAMPPPPPSDASGTHNIAQA